MSNLQSNLSCLSVFFLFPSPFVPSSVSLSSLCQFDFCLTLCLFCLSLSCLSLFSLPLRTLPSPTVSVEMKLVPSACVFGSLPRSLARLSLQTEAVASSTVTQERGAQSRAAAPRGKVTFLSLLLRISRTSLRRPHAPPPPPPRAVVTHTHTHCRMQLWVETEEFTRTGR